MDKEKKEWKKDEKKRKHTGENADGDVGYFRRVDDRLKEGFEDDEMKEMFVQNVLSEVKGKAALVALDRTASITLQHLLPLSSLDQVAEVLKELTGEAGSDVKAVACSYCGSHVVESAIRQMSRWSETPETETEEDGPLEAQVLCLSRMVRESSAEFIKHVHGSHVVRTLLHVMAGCIGPPRTDTQPAAKARHVLPQLVDFDIPTSFWYELKELTENLMTNVNRDAVFQTMLTVCHRKRPKLCKKLLNHIIEYLTSRSAAPGVSPLLVFLKDQASSHLIEKVILLSHKALLRDIYKNHFRGQLVDLALHPIANFTIQRLTCDMTAQRGSLFPKLFDELVEGVEAILAAGHMGVIVQMAESCAESGERQDELMRCLLGAFHCAEPGSRHTSCLPLFLSLLTYEVYYHSDTAEGGIDTQAPLKSMCYHGSRLVQALSKFKERSLLLSSLRALSPGDLLTLAADSVGSHVLQALITTSSDKGRGKILKRLEGQYVHMACSRSGSRTLEAIWSSASVTHRQIIAQELAPSESQLRSDQFARHVWAKFALSHFIHRRSHWMEIQTGESKKRKMFSDLLE
uniref:Nucleolar protein 9 n=1 Tax=Neogobius melanostomus TaxID=47308 RepID=A0A8C6UAU8_9GOBI